VFTRAHILADSNCKCVTRMICYISFCKLHSKFTLSLYYKNWVDKVVDFVLLCIVFMLLRYRVEHILVR
jgi:hypothetical protein